MSGTRVDYSLDELTAVFAHDGRNGNGKNGSQPAGNEITWERLSTVDMRSIVFLDKPLLQADAFTLVVGRKGMGKGTLLANIASRVNRGISAANGTSSGSAAKTAPLSTSNPDRRSRRRPRTNRHPD